MPIASARVQPNVRSACAFQSVIRHELSNSMTASNATSASARSRSSASRMARSSDA